MIVSKHAQSSLVELIFIAVIASSVLGFLVNSNINEQQLSNIKEAQSNLGVHNLLLNPNSSLYVQDLVQNNTAMTDPAWNVSFNTLNSIRKGNLVLLNSNMSILDTKESCSISSLNSKFFTVPILIHNNITGQLIDMKILQYEVCRVRT